MARYKFIERDFPHIVETLVSERGLGSRRDAMNDFHARHGIKAHLRHMGDIKMVVGISAGTLLIGK
jgi:hypothetical protein